MWQVRGGTKPPTLHRGFLAAPHLGAGRHETPNMARNPQHCRIPFGLRDGGRACQPRLII